MIQSAIAWNTLGEYSVSVKTQQHELRATLSDRFSEEVKNVPSHYEKNRLRKAKEKIDHEDANDAFYEFAKLSQSIKDIGQNFRVGADITTSKTNDLFFPKAAQSLAAASTFLEDIRKTAKDVLENIDNISTAFSNKDLEALESSLDGIKTQSKKIEQAFEKIKDQLTT